MKKNYFLLVFMLTFSFHFFAQEYDPVIKEGAFWDVEKGEEFCGVKSYTRYEIGLDTIINNITYKKIRLYDFSGHYEDPCMVWDTPLRVLPNYSYTNEEVQNKIFIREDILLKKVFIWAFDTNSNTYKEYILYDFNLETDGVMTNSYYFRGDDAVISSTEIDANGKKRYLIQNTPSYYTEGLGSETGILPLERIIGPEDPWMFCYGNAQNQNNCATVLSVEKFRTLHFAVSPNPVKEKISLTFNEASTVKIYSVIGQLIETYPLKNNIEIDLSTYKKGVYFLEIMNQNNIRKIGKFIKE